MADRQHGLSRTLPKNFIFTSAGRGEPRTPERSSIQIDVPPPPPRHSTSRLRRPRVRSGTDLFAQAHYDPSTFNPVASDIPLPSIEFPPVRDPSAAEPCPTILPNNDRFLAPPRTRVALKTPEAQIRADPIDVESARTWSPWNPQAPGDPIPRPSSACSNASDSSVSSIETFGSRRSVGGSCTSFESDSYDPFFHIEIAPKPAVDASPLSTNPRTKSRRAVKERWTFEMDNYLWNTYQLYIQDPTITPFKMTPGSIPPLGVTHRVAREAKRSWEKRGVRLDRQFPSRGTTPCGGESTPTQKIDPPKPAWPRSEASTRRRLKYLCKRKFSIAPHYQRMMQSRSPTPHLDIFSQPSDEVRRTDTNTSSSAAYATRDLGVSLVSSSVPGPLAQLAAQDPAPDANSEWFNQPVPSKLLAQRRAQLPTKPSSFDERDMGPRLGSPFTYHTWGPHSARKRALRPPSHARRETIHVTGSRLRSPPRMDPLPNLVNNVPRSSQTTTESPTDQETRRHLEDLLRQGKLNDMGQRRVRIRTRGATTSSVNPQGLEQLFSPPSSASRKEESHPVEKPIPNPLLNLSGDNIRRLGSPFKMEGFRRHAPSLSDPFASGMIPQFRSITQDTRFRGEACTNRLPYDPLEEGISDAERIRRQILNMPYSRR
ncbi:hypothetical protein P175DRAFT_0557323 [Aspergillus ochraceoroseus IBT 24754]|uniref:Uncharacterized protein n=3 Tax=Aspergillus subgen. Nidulantes TaxID=2720870 RepID=A0A0F8V9P7_9EURO|nr:uncharacterized protein P175DRAFT_0557323 [Aspergillus ochraceoroseus IBT 24754]KKK17944.1 hypothetical protein AOCH_007414 [Aspergillus ochraceoroseus]KKK19731.1 hypothetical protein ARAM_006920 [Aspergillus rambellii]PTU20639.1 hypothetical protein P175DRAFT_0557323 [Aspergillus ochraceoroseus IBT 24754]